MKSFKQYLIENSKQYPLAPIDSWWGECNYKESCGKLVYMTPDEFISRVKPLDLTDELTIENINDLIDHVNSGGELDPLSIYDNGKSNVRNSDGRHRAYMAKKLGIEKVPVIDWT